MSENAQSRKLGNSSRTQKTMPKKGNPVEIPVPTRGDFKRDLLKVAPPNPKK